MKIAKRNGKPEIFYSIQGEGKNAGQPVIFVRASLCNLKCSWCDTAYTWDWERYKAEEEIMEMSPQEVVQAVRKFLCKNVVLTGGEPLLQQDDFVAVLEKLKIIDPAYSFEVETNGTIPPTDAFDRLITQYNVSPKLKNSGNATEVGLTQNPKAFFKFVVCCPDDVKEVLDLVAKSRISRERVYLMPEGTTPEALAQKQPWVVEACKELCFRFSPRLHIERFGNRRGT